MGFIVHRSERADVLADALADELATPLADPFRAEVVAVHAKGIERWLTNRLAARLGTSPGRSDGVSANIDLPFPGRLVADALARATGVDPASDPWRPERLVWPLLDVVEANLDEPWLAVLAHHLGRAGSGSPATDADPLADRRFAAVRHLADLYDRYAVHRPAMLQAWADGRDDDGAAGHLSAPRAGSAGATGTMPGRALPDDAVWQAELWRRLRAVIPTDSPPERLASGCRALVADPAIIELPDRFFLFGLTRLPASYLDVLAAMAVHREVHLMALHPSPGLWASITADPLLAPTAATDAVHHPLLRAWGRDSREMQLVVARRLADAGEVVDRHHALPEEPRQRLLGILQHAIRHDLPLPSGDRPMLGADDRSVQVHRCHGRTRQAEVVRDAITHLLADDPTLEPRDVVVMCPDIDEFAPLLRSAFDASAAARDLAVDRVGAGPRAHATGRDGGGDGPPAIPYRLADRSLRQTNPVLGAVAELLTLADARLTAAQVLAFAALTPVRERFGFDDDDLDTMARWIGETGIRWGLDGDHRAPYDLAAVGTGTWRAGLQRLLLGVAMADEDQRLVGGVLPLDAVDSGDIDLAGRMAELIGRLADAVASLTGPQPVDAWMGAIDGAADALFATRTRDAWQRQQLDRLLRDVGSESGVAGLDRPPLRMAEVRDLLADRLRGQPTRAAFRTGDLTMCTLVPMRSVPHRVVCLVGLDDGAFPRGGAPDGDDLLARPDVRQPGDHDRRAEDRQLLLDAVLAARDALVITYAGRDPSTNEERPPAVPVNELLDVLDRTATAEPGPDGSPRSVRELIVHDHPLQPADRRYFRPDSLHLGRPWGFDPALLAGAAALSEPAAPGPADARFLAGPLAPQIDDTVALDDLVKFVEHPARAFLRQRLGLSVADWDDQPVDRLTIELDQLGEWGIANRILLALIAGGEVEAVCAAERARGLLPPGGLGASSLRTASAKAVAVADAARQVADEPRTSLDIDVVLPGGRQVVGAVPDLVGGLLQPTTVSRLAAKRLVAAWTRFVAATAAHPDRDLACTLVGWGGRKPALTTFASLGVTADDRRRRALELLAVIVDLRDRGMREPLPLFTATSHRYAAQAVTNPDALDAAASSWTSTYDRDKEDRDPEHLLVLGGQVTFADILADPPAEDEAGAGWAMGETTRFGRLARRLWDPILDASRTGTPAASETRR